MVMLTRLAPSDAPRHPPTWAGPTVYFGPCVCLVLGLVILVHML